MSCYIESYLHKICCVSVCCVSGREKRFFRFSFLIVYVFLAIIGISGRALNFCESATHYSATFFGRETATTTPLPFRKSASCGVAD